MFSWDEYLYHALSLSKKEDAKEVDFRVSISRAYYSVYNKCCEKFFDTTNETKPVSDSHKFIIDKYKNGKKEARAIGFHLDSLKTSRVDCDYKITKRINKSSMESSLKLAETINTKLDSITEEHF